MNEEDNMPLQPLRESIAKFRKRRELMSWLLLLAMPSAIFGIAVFAIFALVLSFSVIYLVVFAFLVFSSVVSYIAILYIPGALTGVIRKLEFTIQEISFSMVPVKGESPPERIFNQLVKTDKRTREIVIKNPKSKQLNSSIKGQSGKEYLFDVIIHNVDRFGRFFAISKDLSIFAKRIDQIDPVSINQVKEVRQNVIDVLAKMGRRYPSRVLLFSTSGFDDEVFPYVRSKDGAFYAKYIRAPMCTMELIQEKVDGNFDILSF